MDTEESTSLFNSEDGYYLELAIIAYDAWCKSLKKPQPVFSSLLLCDKYAWMSAAGAVFEYLRDNNEFD
jgi:hypothetical protein